MAEPTVFIAETVSVHTTTTVLSVRESNGQSHCRGPLDGSLYAKVNKGKKSENGDLDLITEDTHAQESSNHFDKPTTPTSPNPNVLVLNGNKIVYRPQTSVDLKRRSAPLANLSEFKDSFLSLTSCDDSAPSLSSVTKISLTTSSESGKRSNSGASPPKYQEIMAESIQRTPTGLKDGSGKNVIAMRSNANDDARYSGISSCSATTLSSTTTDDGGPKMELSENETSDSCSIHDVKIEPIDGVLSPVAKEGQDIPTIFSDTNKKETSVKDTDSSSAPTTPAPPVPWISRNSSNGVMQNGLLAQGNSNKSSEYAVPMRDMKITTVPSKRAVLVSTSSEHENMASPSSERRGSVYDEETTYTGRGYETIEEYPPRNSLNQNGNAEQHSYIPEDVQELLNGLTEGPTISDIDSGFHGSSMALQSSSQKIPSDAGNIASQSSSEMSESLGSPVPSSSKELSPMYERNFSTSADRNSPENMNPQVMAKVSFFDDKANNSGHSVTFQPKNIEVEQQTYHASNVGSIPAIVPKKNTNPGVPIPTQTLPEPQPAKVQIITMKNVYTNGKGLPVNQTSQHKPTSDPIAQRAIIPNIIQTQPSGTEYQNQPTKTVEKPPLPPVATSPIEKMRQLSLSNSATIDNGADPYADDLEDELDIENIQSMEEQIKHTQRHLEFLKEQQEKLMKRKQDRTRYRESIKRNSANVENLSGYVSQPMASATTPRQSYSETIPVKEKVITPIVTQPADAPAPEKSVMPPVANQGLGRPISAQHVPARDSWNSGSAPVRTVSDASYNRNIQPQPSVPEKKDKFTPRRHQDKADIIMSSDLQEQLAELDKCIAELTNSMDIPSPKPADEPPVVLRKKSYTLDIERKMDPNVPLQNSSSNSPLVPSPPRRSRSSFDSYKRLSQDFESTGQRRSFTEISPSGNDEVFSQEQQTPRSKKKQSPFPPQTSVTRRQHAAPLPPPKRRLSLEERLSPVLVQALTSNPGAKPKEDIHSYKEDLAPDPVPQTPNFPISPGTPYVNSESPGRSKSPVGLVKTPLSMLHLKPNDGQRPPMEQPVSVHMAPGNRQEDVVDGPAPQLQKLIMPEPQVQAAVALQNGLSKETDLLTDEVEPTKPVIQQNSHQHVPAKEEVISEVTAVVEIGHLLPKQHQEVPQRPVPNHAGPTMANHANQLKPDQHFHTAHVQDQQPTTPKPQYLLSNSSGSHSSHSPAATSSNSRRGSSDSLDGPSTRHSNSSVLSSSSSSSANHNAMHGLHPAQMLRPGSQLSNYERHYISGNASGTRSGDESFGSPQSGRTSSSSISDAERMNYDVSNATVSAAPKFIKDTTPFWYKPNITREEALAILRPKPAGCFIVRDSRCFPGAFGLALKVDRLPQNVQIKPGVDIANEYVRHFLIEPSSRGVKLKGCPNEPVFGSLSALVYQHSITPLALPCRLVIPTADQEVPKPPSPQARQPEAAQSPQATAAELLKQGAACNVIYLGSVDTESLTGPPAIERAIRETYQIAKSNPNMTSIVHFKVTPQGITLTDNARKLFFRRHYPTDTVTFCGLDPIGGANKGHKARRWDATGVKGGPDAWIFGFVARKQSGSRNNACHVFAELDPAQPARAIVNFVMKVLIGFSRQNSTS